jgi:tetratricopeptide (TPR) repeat protein/transglutaminase-like putative cysteine protease
MGRLAVIAGLAVENRPLIIDAGKSIAADCATMVDNLNFGTGSTMSSVHLRSWLTVILLSSIAFTVAPAQSPDWPIAGPAMSASPVEIQTAAAKIQAEPFTEATVFFERDSFSFDAAGRMTYRHTMILRMETQEGVKNWSEIRVGWSPWHQEIPEIRARVIAPDGKVSTLDPNTITDGPAREDGEDTYTDARVRKVPLPSAAAGSIVEQETVSRDKEPLFTGGIGYGNSFSWGVPFHRGELRIDMPKTASFRIKVMALPDAKIKDEVVGDMRHYSLEQGYIPARAESDIPLATHNFLGHGTRFSTGESWASVAATYRKLAEANIDPAKVKSLMPKPGANRQETISRIVAALHKAVRYTGIEFGQASLQPTPAAEILKRHYGDCKDKAALLVAMLREAGIDANLALLDTGPGLDVDPDLPGMQFDHAIVYVPAAQGSAALWIDATAEYAEVGTLPQMDEGRQALIIAEATTGLAMTPEPKADDDHLTELRDVVMADYGPAKISETSMTHGPIDASYRYIYGSDLTREQKEGLEKYAKNIYLAKALVSITHGDAHDMSKPFALKLDMTEAKRGDSGTDDAVVNIPLSNIFYRLPAWFRTDPETEGVKLTPQEEENRKRAVAARTTEYDSHPFVTEWRYTITPPDGFTVRALSANKTTAMGPASFTQKFENSADGKVIATFRFENAKTRYTTGEALALRDAVLAAYKLEPVAVWFDQKGAKLMAGGKIREALAVDRDLIAKNPGKSIHHTQIAYAYLKAGLGFRARNEAQEATRLDPKTAINFRTLGLICQYNELGFYMGLGFDWDCAANALKKALELDPDNSNVAADLAVLEEYDRSGDHYAADAPLGDAIAGLRALKQKDKSAGEKYQDNILFDLLYSGHYQELLDELDKLPLSATRRGMAIAATVSLQGGQKGIAAGIERADQLSANADDRTAALTTAGNLLMRLRLYPETADILSAAVEGQQDSAGTAENIALTRQLALWKGEYLPASDPRAVVQRFYLTTFMGTFTESSANELMTRHAYASDDEWNRSVERMMQSRGALYTRAQRSGLPAAALMDVIAGYLKLTSEGDDESGYRITVESIGAKPTKFFVTRENGSYRVLAGEGSRYSIAGNYLLYLLKSGRDKEARSLLDWMRDSMHKGGGDDPLSGPLLPRFWTVGDPSDRTAMKWAAAALVADNPAVIGLIPDLRIAWEKSPNDETRLNFAMLLATALRTAEDGVHLKEIATEILKKYPDSYTALGFAGRADESQKNWDDWKQLLDAQLSRHPSDETLIRMKAGYLEAHGEWAAARSTMQTLIDKGKATAEDYERYGWSALFDNSVNDDAVKAARQAVTLTNNSGFDELLTLACLYGAQGKTNEARDLMVKTMRTFNMEMPNDSLWFVLATMYEKFGVYDAAIEAYEKVKKPEGHIAATSTYVLAQSRLKTLRPASN